MVGLIYVVFVVAVVVGDDEKEVDFVGIEDYAWLKLIDWLYYLYAAVVVMMMRRKLNL